jgi:hypothetical protein
MDRELLSTYLNDHLAGSTTGTELADRLVGQNKGTRYHAPLARVCAEIKEDRELLQAIMARLDVSESKVKVAGGWAAEKLGRLKQNDRLVSYSPLSRVLEIEGLSTGVQGKLSLWQVLQASADAEPVLEEFDLAELEQRARRQLEVLERQGIDAGREAFAGEPAPATEKPA